MNTGTRENFVSPNFGVQSLTSKAITMAYLCHVRYLTWNVVFTESKTMKLNVCIASLCLNHYFRATNHINHEPCRHYYGNNNINCQYSNNLLYRGCDHVYIDRLTYHILCSEETQVRQSQRESSLWEVTTITRQAFSRSLSLFEENEL